MLIRQRVSSRNLSTYIYKIFGISHLSLTHLLAWFGFLAISVKIIEYTLSNDFFRFQKFIGCPYIFGDY
jgi:hypothetical protein